MINQPTRQLLYRSLLSTSLLIIVVICSAISISITLYLLLFIILSILSCIIHTAFFTDKNQYSLQSDYPYYFDSQSVTKITLLGNKHGFYWPENTNLCDTAFLRCYVKTTLLGWIRDPVLILTHKKKRIELTLERCGSGIRFIPLTNLLHTGIKANDFVSISGKYIQCSLENTILIGFTNPIKERKKLLIFSPHPDDAEIAAFGLYSDHPSTIVTVTAGDSNHHRYRHVIADQQLRQHWYAKLRAFDSISIPQWPTSSSVQAMTLGYPDGGLASLATDQTASLNSIQYKTLCELRRYNAADNTSIQLPMPEKQPNWQTIIDEFTYIIDTIKPTAIVCPHPLIDKHPDHRYTTHAILTALTKAQHSVSTIYCYHNHLSTSRIAPFGPAHTAISLPPLKTPLVHCGKIYMHPLSTNKQIEKLLALDMMHDLREPPTQPLSTSRQYRYALAALFNGRSLPNYGRDDFFRRAIKTHELFICYTIEQINILLASRTFEESVLLNTINSTYSVTYTDESLFDYLNKFPDKKVYRHVKNRITQSIVYQNRHYFVKLHFGIGWHELLKHLLQGRWPVFGAKQEKQAILHCERAGILTTPLLAYGQWGKFIWQRSLVMTHALENMCSLEDLAEAWGKTPPCFLLKRTLIRSLANTAGQFHRAGMHHRDFYLCHFLVPNKILDNTNNLEISSKTTSKSISIYIIDLHRVKIKNPLPNRWLIKDLSALLFSALDCGLTKRDYVYFLKYYANKQFRGMIQNSKFWHHIFKRANALYYKEHHKKPNLSALDYVN